MPALRLYKVCQPLHGVLTSPGQHDPQTVGEAQTRDRQ